MRISSKGIGILVFNIPGALVMMTILVNDVTGISVEGAGILNNTSDATSGENKFESTGANVSNQRTHSDLIRTCSTFREIFSAEMAFSCDYSMLYYKGQCERYATLLEQNETEAKLEADLSFCLDPRVDTYIQNHSLTDAPRSPSLMPTYDSSIA